MIVIAKFTDAATAMSARAHLPPADLTATCFTLVEEANH